MVGAARDGHACRVHEGPVASHEGQVAVDHDNWMKQQMLGQTVGHWTHEQST